MAENNGYKTIAKDASFEFVEKKSKFIGYVARVKTEDEAKAFIESVKKKHWDARHNCSAYVINGGPARSSDDGEPAGTAGKPILEVITGKELVDTAVVVTRYFGGILLGAGGLVRAYGKAAKGAIEEGGVAEFVSCARFSVKCDYGDWGKIQYALAEIGCKIENTEYTDSVNVVCLTKSEDYERVSEEITAITSARTGAELKETVFAVVE